MPTSKEALAVWKSGTEFEATATVSGFSVRTENPETVAVASNSVPLFHAARASLLVGILYSFIPPCPTR